MLPGCNYKRTIQKINVFIIGLVLFFLTGCKQSSNKVVERGFYYWKTEFKLSPEEKQAIEKLKVTKLYIRFFDAVYDTALHHPMPKEPILFKDSIPQSISTVVPVVFITNEVFAKIDTVRLHELAGYIVHDINQTVTGLKRKISEIQMDCDWSASTKGKYFMFLKDIADSAASKHWAVTATIRLYQAKYPSLAGVPPVSRGTLMAYNMSQLTNPATKNSIMDVEEERKYLTALDKYPLKLDVVLPIFYWGVLFRDNRFAGILNNLDAKTLKNNPAFQEEETNNYSARYDMQLDSYSILKDDRIRLESSTDKDMEESISMISYKNKTDTLCLSFFSLDSHLINSAGYEKISDYYSDYR